MAKKHIAMWFTVFSEDVPDIKVFGELLPESDRVEFDIDETFEIVRVGPSRVEVISDTLTVLAPSDPRSWPEYTVEIVDSVGGRHDLTFYPNADDARVEVDEWNDAAEEWDSNKEIDEFLEDEDPFDEE